MMAIRANGSTHQHRRSMLESPRSRLARSLYARARTARERTPRRGVAGRFASHVYELTLNTMRRCMSAGRDGSLVPMRAMPWLARAGVTGGRQVRGVSASTFGKD
jgi:hypothetical protein